MMHDDRAREGVGRRPSALTDGFSRQNKVDPALALSRLIEGQTNSILFDYICLAVKRRSESADVGQVDDGQTNSVLFHLSVTHSSRLTLLNTGDDEGQEIKRNGTLTSGYTSE